MEFEFRERTVRTNLDGWKWGDISQDDIEAVNPQLYQEIAKQIEEKKIAEKLAKEKEKQQKREKAIAKTEELKARVAKLLPDGFEVGGPKREIRPSSNTLVRIGKGNVSGAIEYNTTVYGGWHSHHTNVPWLTHFDYKDRRYKKLETAVKKLVGQIEEKHKANIARATSRAKREEEKVQLKDEATKLGLVHTTETVGYGRYHRRSSHDFFSRQIKEEGYKVIEVKGRVSNGCICEVAITAKMTKTQFKELISFVEQMNIEPY